MSNSVSFNDYPKDLILKSDYLNGMLNTCAELNENDLSSIQCRFSQHLVDAFLKYYHSSGGRKRNEQRNNKTQKRNEYYKNVPLVELLKYCDFMGFQNDSFDFLFHPPYFRIKEWIEQKQTTKLLKVLYDLRGHIDIFTRLKARLDDSHTVDNPLWEKILIFIVDHIKKRNNNNDWNNEEGIMIWSYNTFFPHWKNHFFSIEEDSEIYFRNSLYFNQNEDIENLYYVFWNGEECPSTISKCIFLHFDEDFNSPIGKGLETMEELHFGMSFSKNIKVLGALLQLRILSFGNDFNSSVAPLCKCTQLEEILFGDSFNKSIDTAFSGNHKIRKLKFGLSFNQPVEDALKHITTLTDLEFGFSFNQKSKQTLIIYLIYFFLFV